MLDIVNENDCFNYSDWLKPEAGYKLEFGVCCTYSLDLEAVLGTMLALGLNAELGTDFTNNPEALLKGILEYSNKLVFFCSDCAIKSFSSKIDKFTKLSNLLDNAIFEVKPKSSGIFHPKLWFLHYTPLNPSDKRKPRVRLLILTKNLTFDQSLEFGVSLDADVTDGEGSPNNKPLVEMLDYLKPYMTNQLDRKPTDSLNNRLEKFNELKEAFMHAADFEFSNTWDLEIDDEENDAPKCKFSECEFIPIGIGYDKQEEGLEALLGENSRKDWVICISPFFKIDIIEKITRNVHSGKEDCNTYGSSMLTRRDSINAELLNKIEYCFCVKQKFRESLNDDVANNPPSVQGDQKIPTASVIPHGDIHAKMYFVGITDGAVYFYTGSANATNSAFYKNVEFLVRLKYNEDDRSKNIERPQYFEHCDWLNLMIDDENDCAFQNSPFEWITTAEPSEKDNQKEENYKAFQEFRDHIDNIKARIETTSENEYRVSFEEIDPFFNGIGITIALNGRPTKCVPLQPGACIDGVKSTELSEFYIIDIPEGNSLNLPPKTFVKIIPTDGIPDARDVDVMNSIIDAPDKLYRLFDMFISPRPLNSLVNNMRTIQQSGQKSSSSSRSVNFPGIYEQLLHLAIEDPQRIIEFYNSGFAKLEEAKKKEFTDMIDAFYNAVKAGSNK